MVWSGNFYEGRFAMLVEYMLFGFWFLVLSYCMLVSQF